MKISRIESILTDLGLSETESKVYLAMLDLGPASVQNIARTSKISRTAAYDLIKTLTKKGLVSSHDRGSRKVFIAEEPDQLKTYFANKVDHYKDRFAEFENILPELRVLQKTDSTKVRYYENEEGVEALFRDIKTIGARELFEITNVDAVYDNVDPKILWKLRETSYCKDIKVKVLHCGELRKPFEGAEFKRIKGSVGLFMGTIWIYENRIAFIKFYGKIEVVIMENDVLAQTLRVIFQVAWIAK
ncbi:hypothetical protein KJ766_01515 [Patescibacteria group bacterium]|nr:hypothetical protein [Patescibacteria group bacterium]